MLEMLKGRLKSLCLRVLNLGPQEKKETVGRPTNEVGFSWGWKGQMGLIGHLGKAMITNRINITS
jgi:hypothetical protein